MMNIQNVYQGNMYRSYFLKNGFYAKKGNEKSATSEKVFMKHDENVGGIYAIVENGARKGVRLVVNGRPQFFDNFDKIDEFLSRLSQQNQQNDFVRIMRRRDVSKQLRMLEI